MPSFVAHGAVAYLAARAAHAPRKVVLAAIALSVLPDVDLASLAFDLRPGDALGPQGFTHSFFFALVVSGLLAGLLRERASWPLLFGCMASHGVLDALTHGQGGVALFAPLSWAFVQAPLTPLPVHTVGVREFFSAAGVAVTLAEVFALVLPMTAVVACRRAPKVSVGLVALSAVGLATLSVWQPALWRRPERAIVELLPDELDAIPLGGLGDAGVVTNFDALKAQGLFNARLTPETTPWSSSFFPWWFGGESGRWQDSRVTLLGRTLFGTTPPAPSEVESLLQRDATYGLSPLEKYDLAVGDHSLTATRASLLSTHNGHPRFWYGLCNGVAAAALVHPEPRREVNVNTVDGHVIRFHPIDIKALLGIAYFWTDDSSQLDGDCRTNALDAAGVCAMNPAAFVVAVLNRVGRARASGLVDVFPTVQTQYYAIAAMQVDVVRDRYPPNLAVSANVTSLVDVTIHLTGSSTVLPVKSGVTLESPGHFEAVGLRAVAFTYDATLALDASGRIVGGRWLHRDGPDSIGFSSSRPLLDGGVLAFRPDVRWSVIEALAAASAAKGEGPATLSALPQ